MKKNILRQVLLLFLAVGAVGMANAQRNEVVKFHTPNGTISLQPLTDNAVRVRLTVGNIAPLDEQIYTEQVAQPKWKMNWVSP